MTTATQSATPVPELTSLTRLTAIPLIHEIHETLAAHPLTNRPYNVAQSLSSSALYYCGPIVGRLSPIIVRADGIANKGLDAVESRYPSTFTVHKEDLYKALKERSEYARDVANKTIDERVRDPAYTAVQGLDQRFTPVVDYLVARLGTQQNSSETESKFQYQRAYALSRDLKDQLMCYSNNQLQQLQSNSILVQRATGTAKRIQSLASSTVSQNLGAIQHLSNTMVAELKNIQTAIGAHPANLQASFKPVQEGITNTVKELSSVLTSDLPVNEKVSKVRTTVQDHVTPILGDAATRIQDAIRSLMARTDTPAEAGVPQTTGNGGADSR